MPNRRIAAVVAALSLAAPATASALPADFPEDRSFLTNAAQSNLAEIATGRLALRESENSTVRSYARRMITDHTAAQRKLRAIANALDTSVPSRPSPQQRRDAARLASLEGSAFDRKYLTRQIVSHRQTLGICLLELDSGRVGDLRAYASATAPVVRMHLGMAKTARAAL
jgi:putative membrane protein